MANSLMDLLQGQLSEGMIKQLSQQIGGADQQKTAAATSGIVTTLMGALARNAATPEGANSLSNALDRDHDGSVLDDMMDDFIQAGVTHAMPPANASFMEQSERDAIVRWYRAARES